MLGSAKLDVQKWSPYTERETERLEGGGGGEGTLKYRPCGTPRERPAIHHRPVSPSNTKTEREREREREREGEREREREIR
jgi:hypothetical protein